MPYAVIRPVASKSDCVESYINCPTFSPNPLSGTCKNKNESYPEWMTKMTKTLGLKTVNNIDAECALTDLMSDEVAKSVMDIAFRSSAEIFVNKRGDIYPIYCPYVIVTPEFTTIHKIKI